MCCLRNSWFASLIPCMFIVMSVHDESLLTLVQNFLHLSSIPFIIDKYLQDFKMTEQRCYSC
jgi:hypothetical protein